MSISSSKSKEGNCIRCKHLINEYTKLRNTKCQKYKKRALRSIRLVYIEMEVEVEVEVKDGRFVNTMLL
jgi:hypothetical protein